MPQPTILVHGGAGAIQDYVWHQFQEGAHEAARLGQTSLDQGASALEAAIAAVRFLEDHPVFNAGTGSSLNRDGLVENDALVMTDDLALGAVAGVHGVRNPVLLARAVMEHTPHHLLVGQGAMDFARDMGLELVDPESMVVERRRERHRQMLERGLAFASDPELEATDDPLPHRSAPPTSSLPDLDSGDTVGACAIDQAGRLAVASSTGGIMMKLPGRAGDTPVVGAGSYCGPAGAVTCTGHGESVMRSCLAKFAYDALDRGANAAEAAGLALEYLVEKVNGRAGLIIVDRIGCRAWSTSTPRISIGVPESITTARSGSLP
jgi:L-asparaginase / beta-aspartyl-peptidase